MIKRQLFTALVEGGMRALVLLACIVAYAVNIAAPGLNLLSKSACVLLSAGMIILIILKAKWQADDLRWAWLAKSLLGLHLLGILVWVTLWSTPQIGDYGVYWRCGTMMPWTPGQWMADCKTVYLDAVGVYGKRSFVYTLPIGLLFGSNPVGLNIVNGLLHALTALIAYAAIRRQYSSRAAFWSLLILTLQPEWWYTLTVATPDNLVIPLLLIAFVIIAGMIEASSFFYSAALATILVWIDWSRSIGPFVIMTLMVVLIVNPQTRLKTIGYPILAVVLALMLSHALLMINQFSPEASDPLKALWAFDVTIRPAQNFQSWFEWNDHLWPAIQTDQRSAIGLARFLDEWIVQYRYWPAYMMDKVSVLFKGTGNLYFVGVKWAENVETVQTVANNSVPVGKWSVRLALAMPLLTLPVVALAVLKARLTVGGQVALAFAAIMLVLMIGFAEMLGRYGVLMVPWQVWLVAQLVEREREDGSVQTLSPMVRSGLGLALMLLLYGLGFILSESLKSRHPRLLMGLVQESPQEIEGINCNQEPVPVWPYYGRRMRSLVPHNRACVSFKLPLDQARWLPKALSLFVTRSRLPFSNESASPTDFDYAFAWGDAPLQWHSWGSASAQWHRFDVASFGNKIPPLRIVIRRKAGQGEIQFEIRDLLLHD